MLTIDEINIPIDDIKIMTTLEAGKNIKEALLHYYRNDALKTTILNRCINEYKRFFDR